LQAQIDAIAALHQPFVPTDFPVASMPISNNAAGLWQAAFNARAQNETCPSSSNFIFNDYPPFPLQWQQMEDQSIAQNAKLFDLAHRAAGYQAEWGIAARSTFMKVPFNDARGTANILGDAVLHAHFNGNDALAIQRVNDLLALSGFIGCAGNLISRLVGIGIDHLCLQRLFTITPDLVIAGDPANKMEQAGVDRKEVEALISRLLDEREEDRLRIDAVDSERMIADQQEFNLERNQVWTLGPLVDLSEARVLRERVVDRAAAQANSEAAVTAIYLAAPPLLNSPSPRIGNLSPPVPATSAEWAAVFEIGSMTFQRYLDVEWGMKAGRRSAAIALAIRLYRLDHGDWPANLASLVPAYLPAVPADPYCASGAPIGYLIRKSSTPDGHDRPMLYFKLMGNPENAALPPTPSFDWNNVGPQWRDLSRWYPAAALASSTTESSQ
jgi:hypothetical protein